MSTQTQIDRIAAAKTDIKTSITNKGVTVPAEIKIDGMSIYIDAIDTSENLDEVLTEQESIIDQIQAALEGKASAAGGVKFATGTVTAAAADLGTGQYSYTVTVTGLDFRPSHTVLTAITAPSAGSYAAWGTYDATSYGSYGSATATYTVSENGFQITTRGTYRFNGMFEGTYRWVAWAE